jgi:hypothetical protein
MAALSLRGRCDSDADKIQESRSDAESQRLWEDIGMGIFGESNDSSSQANRAPPDGANLVVQASHEQDRERTRLGDCIASLTLFDATRYADQDGADRCLYAQIFGLDSKYARHSGRSFRDEELPGGPPKSRLTNIPAQTPTRSTFNTTRAALPTKMESPTCS